MIRAALVGYGTIAGRHVQDLGFFSLGNPLRAEEDPLVELVACCARRAETLERFQQETGVGAMYHDLERMLDAEAPDYLHVVTPADFHLTPVLAAARRGVHVLCEKPMAVDCVECDTMNAAAAEAGIQLVISHQRRSDPLHWYAHQLVAEGLIGEPRTITGGAKPRRGGQELHNNGCHLLDAIGIFGGEAAWVSAYCSEDGRPCTLEDRDPGDRDCGWVMGERVDLHVQYTGGMQAWVRFSPDPCEFHWVLGGTEGRLALLGPSLWHSRAAFPAPAETWEPVTPPAAEVTTGSGYVNPPDWVTIREQRGIYPRIFMLRELFQRMDGGGEHTSSGRIGAAPIEIMQAAFASHLTGARVPLPLAERRSPLAA
jgi:predicted dehydrogenase